ncbi:28S ribosomal protein S35, mitochondrial [Cimex lectularius]|uniref:Small ribosomal subunit protein mS35 mitochondrial conserved domain-containing protein n=1 Tax=Cimex lectularius TaxID=79782 RepID=A0A8I6RD59_CIMLE|nr:28S ribosomal protein S35, mitochondrial [Cimex lectularius]
MAVFFNWFGKTNIEFTNRQLLFLINKRNCAKTVATQQETDEDGFRILDLTGKKAMTSQVKKKRESKPVFPPRETRMPVDQIWSDVWPGPRSFHPASVPLPLRQGVNNLGPSPSKWGNAELMKIPNFLHLTPDAIKKHCNAIKKFCSPWPEELTDEKIKEILPVEVITTNYCHSSPTIRDPLSRIVTLKIPLSKLHLDKHARDKFLRIVGERYDEDTDIVTIITDKCPLKKQNYDYAMYLLTVIYHESWVTEPWESEKIEDDMEYYDWDKSKSKENIMNTLKMSNNENKMESKEVEEYKNAVVAVFDEGENDYNWNRYKEASVNILFPHLA